MEEVTKLEENNVNVENNYSLNLANKNKTILKFIKRKIFIEKIRSTFLILIGLGFAIISSFFIYVYFFAKNKGYSLDSIQILYSLLPKELNFLNPIIGNIKIQLIPNLYLLIFIFITSICVLFYGVYDLKKIIGEKKNYIINQNNIYNKIPTFIIIFYRKMIVRKIILNWITAFVFLFGLLSLGILFFLNNQYDNGNKDFYIGFWKLFSLKNLDSEINITLIILIVVYAINIFSLIITKKNKNDIIKNFGYEVISSEEIEILKKKTNKICLIVFLSIITILLFLIFVLLRKKILKKSN
ncbi:MAG: hypothetical protein PPFGHCPK_01363 (plasmid) [Spiroplasma endosymbiont of Drosophila atripex]|nr:MAG: hypothetical protein PPFGHCPK_01363 [Spiroplasma endosymbiont of Drosophila atripex]